MSQNGYGCSLISGNISLTLKIEVDGERMLYIVFCFSHHHENHVVVFYEPKSLLLASMSEMVIAQLDCLVPINFTAEIMIP